MSQMKAVGRASARHATLAFLGAAFIVAASSAQAGEWNKIASKAIAACTDAAPEDFDANLASAGFEHLTDAHVDRVGAQLTYAERLTTYAQTGEAPNPALHANAVEIFTGIIAAMVEDADDGQQIYVFPEDDTFFVITSVVEPEHCGFTHVASLDHGALRAGEFDDVAGIKNPDQSFEQEFLTDAISTPNGQDEPFIFFRQLRPKDGAKAALGDDAIVSQWGIRP
ncbi:hypothetical protein [Roseovarius rhodophyticola]|uniref:Uncharacterized protein n=1 Tax=Roseovarius rhodophyticola TaxID=3080827 RepID=A0ABZ2TIK5_9RHOB|nr:hypothetical protein [Roseovarius sp. W115]MDV2929862.1 hypothetical protein [Roseovarius sp. W115]